jgi:hypothetical protein
MTGENYDLRNILYRYGLIESNDPGEALSPLEESLHIVGEEELSSSFDDPDTEKLLQGDSIIREVRKERF